MKSFCNHKTIFSVIMLAIGIAAGFVGGYLFEHRHLSASLTQISPLRDAEHQYKYIHPLLAYNTPDAGTKEAFKSLENELKNYVAEKENSGYISHASVYFQDLENGGWIGVNEYDKYYPASLIKVVIMISYFKESEQNPDFLKKNLVFTKEINNYTADIPFEKASSLEIGKGYAVEDLIGKMIVDSDNGAKNLLLANISDASLNAVYDSLGIDNPDEFINGNFVISPKTYSLFFRILYSSTYINQSLSEKALSLLAQAAFKDGLISGLPENMTVAHKFGEHILSDSAGQMSGVELHDCGIVYDTKSTYLLCVMTRGNDLTLKKQEDVIQTVTRLVHNEVDVTSGAL